MDRTACPFGYHSRMALNEQLTSLFGPEHSAELRDRHERHRQRHGDAARWQAASDALPAVEQRWRIVDGWLEAGLAVDEQSALKEALMALIPWRKGPLKLGGIAIDTEWCSDWKWNRIAPHIDLNGHRVLDVGCGNGYFGWRMLEAGAESVLGCDPTQLFVAQHEMIRHFSGPAEHELLALRLEDLPPPRQGFDTVVSLGVLYHRRDPGDHLRRLKAQAASGGQIVIETLILPGQDDDELALPGRYANMRNVHCLPTIARLLSWIDAAGLVDARVVDVTPTTIDEQRTTAWMPFHSLAEALSPDGRKTVEGHPPPLRATVVARV
jgi:tRNA (mo5U34)-methyltransferase